MLVLLRTRTHTPQVRLGTQRARTEVVNPTSAPEWDAKFAFMVSGSWSARYYTVCVGAFIQRIVSHRRFSSVLQVSSLADATLSLQVFDGPISFDARSLGACVSRAFF